VPAQKAGQEYCHFGQIAGLRAPGYWTRLCIWDWFEAEPLQIRSLGDAFEAVKQPHQGFPSQDQVVEQVMHSGRSGARPEALANLVSRSSVQDREPGYRRLVVHLPKASFR